MKNVEACCAAMIALGTAFPAAAWDSDVHTAVTQMTRNIWQIPHMSDSFRAWVTAANAGRACYSDRLNGVTSIRESINDGIQRLYLELVCASDEPDHDRNPFKSELPPLDVIVAIIANHKSDPTPYALQEFNDAVSWYEQGYLLASIHALGRSLHYIADLTDFTVEMDSLGLDGSEVRRATRARAQEMLVQWAQTIAGGYQPELVRELEQMAAQFRSDNVSRTTPEEFLDGAKDTRKGTAEAFTEFLNSPGGEGSRSDRFAQGVDIALKGTIVTQEYWITLFMLRILNAAPGRG